MSISDSFVFCVDNSGTNDHCIVEIVASEARGILEDMINPESAGQVGEGDTKMTMPIPKPVVDMDNSTR